MDFGSDIDDIMINSIKFQNFLYRDGTVALGNEQLNMSAGSWWYDPVMNLPGDVDSVLIEHLSLLLLSAGSLEPALFMSRSALPNNGFRVVITKDGVSDDVPTSAPKDNVGLAHTFNVANSIRVPTGSSSGFLDTSEFFSGKIKFSPFFKLKKGDRLSIICDSSLTSLLYGCTASVEGVFNRC